MSLSGNFFTNEDGEVVKLSAIIAVEPLVGSNGGSYYEVVFNGGHITIKDSYYSRANFLTAWQGI